jgi:DeoR family transcriptional regulator, ulaG and ulaABCDEF operon transcriptional repressor
MHESERHRIILSAIEGRPVVTVADLVTLTGASEATIRRDIAALHVQKRLRRVRGGAESIAPPQYVGINARPFSVNEGIRLAEKRAIARAAVELCADGDAIIVNGGTTTFQMVHPLSAKRCQVFTNSFPIAEHLLRHSKNTVLLGLMEGDPLLVQAEQKLIGQADELVVLADSTKFAARSSLLLCPLKRISTVITDEGITDRDAAMLEAAEVRLIVARIGAADRTEERTGDA